MKSIIFQCNADPEQSMIYIKSCDQRDPYTTSFSGWCFWFL